MDDAMAGNGQAQPQDPAEALALDGSGGGALVPPPAGPHAPPPLAEPGSAAPPLFGRLPLPAAGSAPAGGPAAGLYRGYTVLAFGAHPDDLELGVGGTLARMARAGAKVVGVVASVPARLEVRVAEAERAAEIVGMHHVRFLARERPTRIEEYTHYDLVERIQKLLAEYSPAVVLTHSEADFHCDHVLLYGACYEACGPCGVDMFSYYPTMTRPVTVDFRPTVFVDVSDVIEVKMDAIEAYRSQFLDRELETDFCRAQAREHGRRSGVMYAEGLQAVRLQV